ncbi:uncharacterized protein [Henckelia pumila]|uniref:uncharacterized protein n=1 Tax=Henckelia pumila TaxID=405737 RepID=UPI003C6E1735
MEALRQYLRHLLSFHVSLAATISKHILPKIPRFPFVIPVVEAIMSLYFRFFCNLEQCTIDLDDRTTMHFWAPAHRKFNKPNLLMIHGYGGNSKFQFAYQVGSLAESFNLYIPDLLFFGRSHTNRANRTEIFQAECVWEGLRGMGVNKCSIYAISYGGYVGYRVAEIHPEMVEKMVIVSSGVGCNEDRKWEQLKSIGRDVVDMLLPGDPDGVRLLMDLSIHKFNHCKWAPDFVLQEFVDVMCNENRRGKQELVEHLIENKAECNVRSLTQETLLVWGDKDKIFPISFAHELQRNLGPNAKLEIIPDTGHAVNIDSPYTLNALIKGFVLPSSNNRNIVS